MAAKAERCTSVSRGSCLSTNSEYYVVVEVVVSLKVMRARELVWLSEESARNMECLAEMRTFVPPSAAAMTRQELQQAALAAGAGGSRDTALLGLMPAELAQTLKECSLLHWVTAHEEDIRKANFLVGDGAKHFNNLERWALRSLSRMITCVRVV